MSLLDRSGVKASTKPTRRQPSILSTHRRPARSSPAPPARRSKRNETVSIVNRHPIPRDRVARIDARADKTETRRPRERARSTTRSIALDRRVAARRRARERGGRREDGKLFVPRTRESRRRRCVPEHSCLSAGVSECRRCARVVVRAVVAPIRRSGRSEPLVDYILWYLYI